MDFSQFANQGYGFSQFSNQQGFGMPVQTNYNEFHLNPSPPLREQFQRNSPSEEEYDEVPETQEQEDEDEEEAEEEQEVVVVARPKKSPARPWTQEEEAALSKAYINVSQDPYKGNHQKKKSFWKNVLAEFNAQLNKDSGRNHHQVTSKWKDLNTKVGCFAGIYNKKKSNMASGMNDEDVLKAAHKEYLVKMNTKNAFNHFAAWEVMKDCPKWSEVPTFEEFGDSSSKRAKTSESNYVRSFEAEFPIDLNDDQCDQDEPPARPTPPPRRKGKNTVASSSTEREELVKMLSTYNAEKLKMKEREMEARIARDQEVASLAQEKKRQMLEQQKQADLEFLCKSHNDLTGPLLQAVLDRKREIAERWGWQL